MRSDRFTLKAQEAVQRAHELASERGHPEVRPLHLLVTVVRQPEGVVAPILGKLGCDPRVVASRAAERLQGLTEVRGANDVGFVESSEDVRPRSVNRFDATACILPTSRHEIHEVTRVFEEPSSPRCTCLGITREIPQPRQDRQTFGRDLLVLGWHLQRPNRADSLDAITANEHDTVAKRCSAHAIDQRTANERERLLRLRGQRAQGYEEDRKCGGNGLHGLENVTNPRGQTLSQNRRSCRHR